MFKFVIFLSLFVVAMTQELFDPPRMPEMPKMPKLHLTHRVVRQAPTGSDMPKFPGQGGEGSGFPGADPNQWLQKGQEIASEIADKVKNFGRNRRGV